MEKVILEGKLTAVDVPNIYNELLPKEVLLRELNSAEFKELMYWNAVIGTLSLDDKYIDITEQNSAILLKEYDEYLNAKFEVLDTSIGYNVKKLYNEGKKFIFGYSGGGLYYMREDGIKEIYALNLITFNIIGVKD